MDNPTPLLLKPHPGPQERFHLQTNHNVYECLFGAAKGPGKTQSLLTEGLRQIHLPNYRAIIFRRTYPRLGEIIDRSFKYFKGLGGKYSDKDIALKIPAWTFPKPNAVRFEPGAKYAFGHCQNEPDKYNYQGKEFHYLGFDQVEEFTLSQYLFLLAQNRTSDRTIKCYIRATANPGGVGHAWVKKRWIDCLKPGEIKYFTSVDDEDIEVPEGDSRGISRSFVPASVYDNPSIIQNDPNYVKRLEQLPEQDKQALLHGNWEVFSGQFFKMWRKHFHVIEKPIMPSYRKFLSLDYGYGKPSSVGWWQIDYDGNMHRYRELYKERLTYQELAEEIMRRTPVSERMEYCTADPAIWGDKSHHKEGFEGESGAETMRKTFNSFTALIPADNDRVIGWGRLRILLTPDSEGRVKISCSPSCKDSIRTLPALIHDTRHVEDVDTEGEDHAPDEWRYAVMSRPSQTDQPVIRKSGIYVSPVDEDIQRMREQYA